MKINIKEKRGGQKKAVSEILATILIVLFVIAALVIVSVVLFQFIRKQSQEITAGCVTIGIAIIKAEHNSTSNYTIAYVKRDTGDAEMAGMKFIFDGKEKIPSEESDYTALKLLETGKYIFKNISSKPKKIEAAPIIRTEAGKEMNCGIKAIIRESDIVEKSISAPAPSSPQQFQDIRAGLIAEWKLDDLQYDDNFESGYDSNRWSDLPSDVNVSNGKLNMYANASGSIYKIMWPDRNISGDFDVQVDFNLIVFPSPPSNSVGTSLRTSIDPNNEVSCERDRGQWGNRYIACSKIGGAWTCNQVLTSDTSGKFRIARTGTNIKCYYYSGGWVQLGSYTLSSSPVQARLIVNSLSGYATETKFDNFIVNNGEIAADASGNNNNGIINGAAWNSSGKYGNALSFDGVDDYISFASETPFHFLTNGTLSEFTIGTWFKISDTSSPSYGNILFAKTNPGGYNDFDIAMDTGFGGKIRFHYGSSGGRDYWSNTIVNTGQWVYFALTRTNSGDFKIYINGNIDKEFTDSANVPNHAQPAYIAKSGRSGAGE
ncbi:hypothetical protein HYT92_03680 [Candidatus Pacearchaeota archaeon]|nr:hypothetical protein [Candidatus Pacearchaeota archaeon]